MSEKATNPTTILTTWLSRFETLLEAADAEALAALFLPHGWFRDILILTWDFRALRGPSKIAAYLQEHLHAGTITNIDVDDDPHLAPSVLAEPKWSKLEGAFRFQTVIGHGRGYVQLVQQSDSTWRALLVCITLTDLRGHEELRDPPDWEAEANGRSWAELDAERQHKNETDPYVLISRSIWLFNFSLLT